MDTIELQEVDDFIGKPKLDLQYPYVMIEGVTTEEEREYFLTKFTDKNKSLPLYLKIEDRLIKTGSLELSVDSLLVVRSLDDYNVTLVIDESTSKQIDLNTPETFLNFLTLF